MHPTPQATALVAHMLPKSQSVAPEPHRSQE